MVLGRAVEGAADRRPRRNIAARLLVTFDHAKGQTERERGVGIGVGAGDGEAGGGDFGIRLLERLADGFLKDSFRTARDGGSSRRASRIIASDELARSSAPLPTGEGECP